MSKLMVLIASNRTHRVGGAVGEWVAKVAQQRGDFEVDVADLREIQLPFYDEELSPKQMTGVLPPTIAWAERVNAADGFLIVSPEYNGSFPATLKNALDTVIHEWAEKPVGIVGYGWGGGSRMIDHLAAILPNYKLEKVADDANIGLPWDRIENGQLTASAEDATEVETVLDELALAVASRESESVDAA